jgi:hypothetical protein
VDKIFGELLNLLDNFFRMANHKGRQSEDSHLGYSDFLSIIEELTPGWPSQDVVNLLEVTLVLEYYVTLHIYIYSHS